MKEGISLIGLAVQQEPAALSLSEVEFADLDQEKLVIDAKTGKVGTLSDFNYSECNDLREFHVMPLDLGSDDCFSNMGLEVIRLIPERHLKAMARSMEPDSRIILRHFIVAFYWLTVAGDDFCDGSLKFRGFVRHKDLLK